MPPAAFQDIPAYKIYASYASRPSTVGVWRKNHNGKFCIQSGELMCRYEADGVICPNTTRFKSRTELGKHVRENHDAKTVAYGTGARSALTQHEHLTAYYTDLVQIMRQDPLAMEQAVGDGIPEAVPQPMPRNIPNVHPEEAEDGDQEDEDEDLEDAPAAPAASSRPAPANIGRIKSYGVTELPSKYNFLNPRPRSPSPPSRLPASLKPKFDLHDGWDPKVLKAAKAEDAKIIRRATSENWDTSLVDGIKKAKEDAKERNEHLS